jgi:hypothetical protein
MVAFGAVPVACGAIERTVEVSSEAGACLAEARLVGACDDVDLVSPSSAGCAPFGGGPLTVRVSWSPQAVGDLECALEVRAERGNAEATRSVPLTGSTAGRERVDNFVSSTPEAIDLLFVVDDSGSMTPYQDALSAVYDDFVRTASENGVDWRLGVTTTDTEDSGPQGRFQGVPPFFGPGPDAEARYAFAVERGNAGSGTETGLQAMLLAIDPVRNVGFRRANTDLAYLVLTDEDDQSMVDARQIGDRLLAAAGVSPERVHAAGIAGVDANGRASVCVNGAAVATDGAGRYVDAFDRMGGRLFTICQPMEEAVRQMTGRIFGPRRAHRLTLPPDGEVVVEVNGRVSESWNYAAAGQLIRLERDAAVPPAGTRITARYNTDCGR